MLRLPSASVMVFLKCRYTVGKVIGAGSFGVVREAVHKKTNVHYACKTIPKLPKKGRGTPRYLLKIQTEVDAMLQLGPSLDAVFLQALLLASQSMPVSCSACIPLPILQLYLMHDRLVLQPASPCCMHHYISTWPACYVWSWNVSFVLTCLLCLGTHGDLTRRRTTVVPFKPASPSLEVVRCYACLALSCHPSQPFSSSSSTPATLHPPRCATHTKHPLAPRSKGKQPALISMQDVFEDDVSVHLVMELCTGGGILDKIKQHNYTERRISQIMRSIIRFISQCHAKGIIYRDIKPDNFLFLNKDENSAIRATDFGLSIR